MVGQRFQLFGAVDRLFPFITFHLNYNAGFQVTGGIDGIVYFQDGSGHARIDGCRYEASCLSNEGAHFHMVALIDNRFCGSADMLRQRIHSLCRQCGFYCRDIVGEFVLFRMNTTHFKSSQFHFSASLFIWVCSTVSFFSTGFAASAAGAAAGLSFLGGKLTATMAFVGQASSHFLQRRHFSGSM